MCIKEHYEESEKTTHRIGKNTCKVYIWNRICRITLTTHKQQNPHSKMDEGAEQTLLQWRYRNGQ